MSHHRRFLESLFHDAIGPGRELVLVYTEGKRKRSLWCPSIDDAVKQAEIVNESCDVYFGAALQDRTAALAEAERREIEKARREERRRRPIKLHFVRGYESTAQVLGGLWVDFDIANPHHEQKGLPVSVDEIFAGIAKLPLQPTCSLLTGGGVHAWWRFHEPMLLRSDEERARAKSLSRGWQAEVRRICGFTIDSTHDLARMMRLPGLVNHKYGKPVVEIQR